MALSDRWKKSSAQIAQERERLATERAQEAVDKWKNSEQFRLSALATPEGAMAVDAVVKVAVSTVLDPVGSYQDTLRAKGFRPAEIRQITHRMYLAHCVKFDEEVDESKLLFDNMVGPVADYMIQHQELYNSLNPEDLRRE